VRDAACILHAARLFVCCDSGLMHLALAAGTPTLALFGPTEPTILIRDDPNFSAIKSEAPCQGCWNVSQDMQEPGVCPLERAKCLESIQTIQMLDRVRGLLE
jgi:ADP-heptose:LPS heptosyltransferase